MLGAVVRLRMELGDSDDGGAVELELRARLHAFNVAVTGIDDGALLVITVRDARTATTATTSR